MMPHLLQFQNRDCIEPSVNGDVTRATPFFLFIWDIGFLNNWGNGQLRGGSDILPNKAVSKS